MFLKLFSRYAERAHQGATVAGDHRYDVRNLIRRIIVGWMAVCLKTGSKEKCLELLKAATINQDGQAQIAEATEGAWSLIDGAMRRAWGPKYDQRTEPASE